MSWIFASFYHFVKFCFSRYPHWPPHVDITSTSLACNVVDIWQFLQYLISPFSHPTLIDSYIAGNKQHQQPLAWSMVGSWGFLRYSLSVCFSRLLHWLPHFETNITNFLHGMLSKFWSFLRYLFTDFFSLNYVCSSGYWVGENDICFLEAITLFLPSKDTRFNGGIQDHQTCTKT